MGDYSTFIAITYAVSAAALIGLAFTSFRGMKTTEQQAASLRRRRKKEG